MSRSILDKLRHFLNTLSITKAESPPRGQKNHDQSATSSSNTKTPVSNAELRQQQLGALAPLPNELLIQIITYLPYSSQACLSLTNKHLKHTIGPICWYRLQEPSAKTKKLDFLCQIGRDTPAYIACRKCTAFHRKEMFLEGEMQKKAQERICDQYYGRITICSHDSIGFARFRAIMAGTGSSPTHGISLRDNGRCQEASRKSCSIEDSYSMVMVQGSVILRTRFSIPAATKDALNGHKSGFYSTLGGCDNLLCPHNAMADSWLSEFCACRRVHIRDQSCTDCPYPVHCAKCATEIDQAIEVIDAAQCLVVTTWRRLGNGEHSSGDWELQCRRPYSSSRSGSSTNYGRGLKKSTRIREDFALGWHLRSLREEGFDITEDPAWNVSSSDKGRDLKGGIFWGLGSVT